MKNHAIRGGGGGMRLLTSLGVAGAALAAVADGASLESARTFYPGTTSGVYVSGVPYEGCASGETLSVASRKVAAFPEELKDDVLFCLDASDRANWGFADGSDKQVVRIPSKYGSRFLTTEKANWNNGEAWGTREDLTVQPPELAEDAELGATVLDFGSRGSGRALCFNAEGTANYVNLSGIGTIVTLRGTQAGGGWLLGGGGKGYAWHRGESDQAAKESVDSCAAYDSPFASGNAAAELQNATVYADGQRTAAASYTFSGGWDLLAVQPTAAALTALGLGMGDARSGSYSRNRASGGFKVAEMIVFNRLLTEEEIQDVLAYLRTKWLARAPRDYNGRTDVDYMRVYKADTAHNQPGLSFGLDVAADETLTVWDLDGGRIRTTSATALDDYGLTKTGAGTLSLVDASGYGNRIDLREGTLAFPAKPVPASLGAFPVAVHFDASAASTVEADAEGCVVRWSNSSAQPFKGEATFAAVPSGATAPTLVTDALGAGMNVVDFGVYGSGRSLAVVTNATAGSVVRQQVQTVLAVVDVAQGGGSLLSGVSARDGRTFVNGIGCFSAQWDARCYVNGVRIDPSKGYPYPGWVIVALQGTGNATGLIGGADGTTTTAGGLRIAELVICKGALSEEAILDASAYLAHKWLGKSLPGYAATGSPSRPDVQRLATSGDADAVRAIRVDAGRTAKVVPSGAVRFEKTGAGTLEIVADGSLSAAIDVKAGAVRYVRPAEPAAEETFAASPALHVDPSRPETLKVVEAGGKKYVRWAADASGGDNAVYAPQGTDANSPVLNETDTVNGLPVLDFDTAGRYMAFVKGIDNVRAVFAVFGSQEANGLKSLGPLLGYLADDESNRNGGYMKNVNISDFQGGEGGEPVLGSGYVSPGMTWFTNGVPAVRSDLRSGGYELIEAHPAIPAHAGGLQRYERRCPGVARYGEILVYDRALTAREVAATRNYLLKKWFPSVPRAELPEAAVSEVTLTRLAVDCGASASAPLVCEGTLAFAADIAVKLTGLPQTRAELEGFSRVIATAAGGFKDVRKLRTALWKLPLPVDGWRADVRVDGTGLVLTFGLRPGLAILVR